MIRCTSKPDILVLRRKPNFRNKLNMLKRKKKQKVSSARMPALPKSMNQQKKMKQRTRFLKHQKKTQLNTRRNLAMPL